MYHIKDKIIMINFSFVNLDLNICQFNKEVTKIVSIITLSQHESERLKYFAFIFLTFKSGSYNSIFKQLKI